MSKNKNKQKPKSGMPTQPAKLWGRDLDDALAAVAAKRTGGAINIRGLEFQLLYAAHMALTTLKPESTASIRLEGLEDVDLHIENASEFVQAKTSQNKLDASAFWDLGVLENFFEVYKISPSSTFRLVHSISFAKGMVDELILKQYSEKGLAYWSEKFKLIAPTGNIRDFLELITFERCDASKLQSEIIKSLIGDHNVNLESVFPFVTALFFNVFDWSKSRATIRSDDIVRLVQSVKDSFSGFPENPALQHKWIAPVKFEANANTDLGYFDGKAARPADIARGLPVKRPTWEGEIGKSLSQFDVTVIRSSSGQGKSTLAWMSALTSAQNHKIVYQVSHCFSRNESVAIADFIESRLLLGEMPVVVIDGLNQETSHWFSLAEILRSKPVKLIITTREEDWARYGSTTAIEVNIIEIRLSIAEAKEIFHGLRNSNKLHATTKTWEPAWERVKDKGLLIEFVYLLTQGEMIEARLSQQIRNMADDKDSAAKAEILRLMSIADVLGIRIRTQKLTDHIQGRFQLSTDRNELYRQLEKEYYLKFAVRYVEGLHPVRSQHLVDIMNSNIGFTSSLLDLLKLIEDDYLYEFFISAPLKFDLEEDFFSEAANQISTRPYSEMVYVVDGLMHSEPYRYWQLNRAVYDEIFRAGGLDLAVYDTVPINKLNSIEKFAESLGDKGENLRYIGAQLTKLKPYDFKTSSVFRFAKHLRTSLLKRPISSKLEGLSFLYRWFKAIGLDFPNIIEVKEKELMSFLKLNSVDESAEIFSFYFQFNPDRYKSFIAANRTDIVAWIKQKTNTLTIEEVSDEIHIKYLLDNDVKKINESSVYRINVVRAFFPFYSKYCTEALILPFPNEATTRAAHQMSIKAITPKDLPDEFNVHINRIWAKSILDQYAADSAYDWQRTQLLLREKIVSISRKCIRTMEAGLENNVSRIRSQINEFQIEGNEYLAMSKVRIKYPPQSRKYFERSAFEKQELTINKFQSSFRAFVEQFYGLVAPKNDDDSRLPIINIKDAVNRLEEMQNAFEEIASSSHKYFPTDEIRRNESITIPRLARTAEFYRDRLKTGHNERIVAAENAINAWVRNQEEEILRSVGDVICSVANDNSWQFTMPTKVVEIESIKYVTIAVQNLDIAADLFDFSIALKDLATTDVHYFVIIFADNTKRILSALQFGQRYFAKFKAVVEGDGGEDDYGVPLNVDVADSKVVVPAGFFEKRVQLKHYEDYFKMMFDIWKLSEYRTRLRFDSSGTLAWLSEIEAEYKSSIEHNFRSASSHIPQISPSESRISAILSENLTLTQTDVIEEMLNMVDIVTRQQMEKQD
ncbi:MAG: hypothetical protein ABI663_19665 [Chryseolinea sp.]